MVFFNLFTVYIFAALTNDVISLCLWRTWRCMRIEDSCFLPLPQRKLRILLFVNVPWPQSRLPILLHPHGLVGLLLLSCFQSRLHLYVNYWLAVVENTFACFLVSLQLCIWVILWGILNCHSFHYIFLGCLWSHGNAKIGLFIGISWSMLHCVLCSI